MKTSRGEIGIIKLIESIDPLLDGKANIPAVRLRLAQIRLSAEDLLEKLAREQAAHAKSNAENRAMLRMKTKHARQLAELADAERKGASKKRSRSNPRF